MPSQGCDSEFWEELLPPGTRPERDPSEPDSDFRSGKSCKSCLSKRALSCRAARGIFKLLNWTQQADDAFFREHGGASLESFDLLEKEFSAHSTQDTIPITCYSRNSNGRWISLQSALSSGCISIEMTLFPAGNELLIAANPDILARAMNLRGLYIDPLLRTFQEHYSKLEKLPSGAYPHQTELSGVFSHDPTQSLVLLMNVDADPERVWSQLILQLEPLREAGFLTYFNGSAVVPGPITIVATGNVPFHRILERSTFRDVFFDAPLLQLLPLFDQGSPQYSDYNAQTSYYASADFRTAIGNVDFNGFSDQQLADVRHQVQLAHGLGLKVRYLDTPDWPRKLRNYVWRILAREGVDIITVDESVTGPQGT
ncbi:uncharacterized protein N7498_001939 [Penicillium cinerascens]|uniref:Altered inheritance of mitochondria protein 6 n=1 Tax=Penicillium cinerascens TaxID=70096 RepID=A0A9W9N952_9EURO|nr:uncharacterized protein N7498_001939 [Penicillium cinerascens]KAJ5215532.1 hypothetical protein N7498_001939 [Penicillium cinerascens]